MLFLTFCVYVLLHFMYLGGGVECAVAKEGVLKTELLQSCTLTLRVHTVIKNKHTPGAVHSVSRTFHGSTIRGLWSLPSLHSLSLSVPAFSPLLFLAHTTQVSLRLGLYSGVTFPDCGLQDDAPGLWGGKDQGSEK